MENCRLLWSFTASAKCQLLPSSGPCGTHYAREDAERLAHEYANCLSLYYFYGLSLRQGFESSTQPPSWVTGMPTIASARDLQQFFLCVQAWCNATFVIPVCGATSTISLICNNIAAASLICDNGVGARLVNATRAAATVIKLLLSHFPHQVLRRHHQRRHQVLRCNHRRLWCLRCLLWCRRQECDPLGLKKRRGSVFAKKVPFKSVPKRFYVQRAC